MQNITLQKGIEVQKFQGMDNEDSYVISYKNRNWKVSEFVADVIRILKYTDSVDILTTQLTEEYELNQIDSAITHTIDFLEKNGLLSGHDPIQTQKQRNSHIWGRLTILSESIVCRIKILCFLFLKPLISFLSLFSLLWIVYAITSSSAADLSQQIIHLPLRKMVLCYGVMILIGLLHELGHSSALMFFGEKPGRIGFAFYMLSFVFFSDVNNAWKLTRKERILVDYGGIYFQSIFSAMLYIINLLWLNNDVLRIVTLVEAILVLENFNPFFKYDGYWMLCDMLGTTNVINVVLKFWKGVLQGKKANQESRSLNIKLKILIISYTIGSAVYIVYFLILVFSAAINTTYLIYSDINYALTNEIIVNISNILQYIMNRFSAYLLWLLILRLLMKSIAKIFKHFQKERKKLC